jgi:hypothetical protein
MGKIYSVQINTLDMPTEATSRSFTVIADKDSEFTMFVLQEGTLKYYDWVSEVFELGHNDTNNNLKVIVRGSNYTNNIKFPSGGGTYIIKLIPSSGSEIQGFKKHVITKSITKQSANSIVTFSPATANTANYATFPTKTSTGGSSSVDNFDFDWNVVNWNGSADAGSYGLRLTGIYKTISDKYWYFTTTDTVDGAVTSSTTVVIDDLTDIVVGMVISGVSSGSLSGMPTITNIDTDTKTLTLNVAQTFADGITLTFKAIGSKVIKDAIGLDVTFTEYPTVTPTILTHTVRTDSDGDYTTSTTITLTDTRGIAGGNLIGYKGIDVNNSSTNKVTSVSTPDPDGAAGDGAITVQLTQLLRAGTVLTFDGVHKTINFNGNIIINSYPDANRTIYLDLDKFITVGAQS